MTNGFLPDALLPSDDEFLVEVKSDSSYCQGESCRSENDNEPLCDESSHATTSSSTRREPQKSVLKTSLSYTGLSDSMPTVDNIVIPIRTDKSAWKTLPPPPPPPRKKAGGMRTSESSPALSRSGRMTRNHVSFTQVHVRAYDMTLGDHPACVTGTPVTLDWQYLQHEPLHLEQYEQQQQYKKPQEAQARNTEVMRLGSFERECILKDAGFSRKEMQQARQQVDKQKRQRSQTVSWLPLMPLEELIQRAKRKLQKRPLLVLRNGIIRKNTLTKSASKGTLFVEEDTTVESSSTFDASSQSLSF